MDADVPAARLKAVRGLASDLLVGEELRRLVDWVAWWTLAPRGMVLRMVLRSRRGLSPEPAPMGLAATGRTPARMTPARERVLALLADGRVRPKGEIAAAANVSAAVVTGLEKAGALAPAPLEAAAPGGSARPFAPASAAQAEAAAALAATAREGGFSVTLLDGVTGSGKTGAFLEAVAATVAAGRQALVMMPEIALTDMVTDAVAARFGRRPAEWHSGLTGKARARTWRGVATGEVPVVVGARSALFLPFRKLGLVVVDEEHDGSFKQDDGVAYNARDMAVVRGRLAGAPVILASATPSIESRNNAGTGRYRHLVLPARGGGASLPAIELVDLSDGGLEPGRFVHPRLAAATERALAEGRQALFFLNRRGYAPLTVCRACGHRITCPNCTAWLVDHRLRGRLQCHHCGHAEPRPQTCPHCGAEDTLAACGPGVERIEEEVRALFPDARVAVLSSDAAGGPAEVRRQLSAVAAGGADIAIGTQLLAKGFTFPSVGLVGVVDADIGLHGVDPRAAERTFQLLTQVTGRAGRTGGDSRGLVQTHAPDHPVMRALADGDREAFYRSEIDSRRQNRLPPFARLAAIVVFSPDRALAQADARHLARTAPLDAALEVLGPAEAPIAILRGRHRFRLLVRSPRGYDLQGALRGWLAAAGPERGSVRRAVDIDPQSFL